MISNDIYLTRKSKEWEWLGRNALKPTTISPKWLETRVIYDWHIHILIWIYKHPHIYTYICISNTHIYLWDVSPYINHSTIWQNFNWNISYYFICHYLITRSEAPVFPIKFISSLGDRPHFNLFIFLAKSKFSKRSIN